VIAHKTANVKERQRQRQGVGERERELNKCWKISTLISLLFYLNLVGPGAEGRGDRQGDL